MSNNNNNNAYGVGDLIQQNDDGKTLWMTVVVKRDLSYDALLKCLRSNNIKTSSYSWNSSVSYDCANYKRDRTSYRADLEVVKTKSKEKPNPRYNITILMSCVDQGEKQAFVHHDDDERTMRGAMERRSFYALGDARMDLQEAVKTAHNRHLCVNSWTQYLMNLGLIASAAAPTLRKTLDDAGLGGYIKFSMNLPNEMADWDADSPHGNGSTLEQQQAYIQEVEKRGEFVNDWCGKFQKKFCSEFRLRNTMLHSDDYDQMFDDCKQVWAKHLTRPWQENSSYHHSAIGQEFVFHHLGALVIEDKDLLRAKLKEIHEAQGHRGGNAESDLFSWWVEQRPMVKTIVDEFELTDRYSYNPSIQPFISMSDAMLADYANVDRSVFDGDYLWDNTHSNAETVYGFARGGHRHHHGVDNQDDYVEQLITALGGSYSLWD